MFVCWGVSRCPWACAEGWSDAIKKTILGRYPCYTISLRPENTIFPSCAPHWLFSQMVKSSRCAGEGASILFRDIFTIPSYLIQFALAEVITFKGQKHDDPCHAFCWRYIYALGEKYRFICKAQAKQDGPYLEWEGRGDPGDRISYHPYLS